MFRRRHPLPLLGRLRAWFWPVQGFRRSTLYIAHRLGRLPGTPYRIAAGFACGAAVSCTPFIGFHFLLAVLLSLLLRGNLIASAVGTAIGNPWTFPFIWTWIFWLGSWMLGRVSVVDLPDHLTLAHIFENPLKVLWPMVLGGIPTGIVTWFAFFFPVRSAVAQYQARRRRRLMRRDAARALAAARSRAHRDVAAVATEEETGS